MHVIAAKAVAFGEALRPEFRAYSRQIVANAQALAEALKGQGLDLVTGGTDNHLLLVDLRPKKLTGKRAEHVLDEAGITCNKNGIPFDPEKPAVTSGIRLGSGALTSRGFDKAAFEEVGRLINRILDAASEGEVPDALVREVRGEVVALCNRYPIYDTARG
jgi:glycine hydroxymethyltransferase